MPINPAAAGATANPMAAGANPAAAAASPLGVFEALLGAMFGAEGQGVSALGKAIQPAGGEATTDGAADGEAPASTDGTAAQSLLAAFAMTPQPIIIPATTDAAPQGEAQGAAPALPGTPVATPPITVPIDPSLTAPAQDAATDPALAAPAQAASTDAAQVPAATPEAKAPDAAAALVAGAADLIKQAVKGEPAPLDKLAGLTPPPVEAEAAPAQPSQPATTPPTTPQDPQLAAAPLTDAAKTAPPPAPSARHATAAAPNATSTEAADQVQTEAADAAPKAVGSKISELAEAAGLRKFERAEAPTQAQAQQADAPLPPSHTPATADTLTSVSTSAPHAAAAQGASLRGAPETVATLAAEILKKLDSRTSRFDMELEPLGLGKVDVRLEIGANGRLTAAMAFENPQSAQELKNRSGELARALEQAGFNVTDGLSFDVADNPSGQGQNNSAQEQSSDAPWRGRAFLAALETAAGADTAPTTAAALYVARQRAAGVDIKI